MVNGKNLPFVAKPVGRREWYVECTSPGGFPPGIEKKVVTRIEKHLPPVTSLAA
jgi:hypothetical protein